MEAYTSCHPRHDACPLDRSKYIESVEAQGQRRARRSARGVARRPTDNRAERGFDSRATRRVNLQQRSAQKIAASHEARDEGVSRPLVDLMRRSDLRYPAVGHDCDAVRQCQRLRLIVRDVDRRDADVALQTAQFASHLLAKKRVEIAQRLVQQQKAAARRSARAPAPTAAAGRHSTARPSGRQRRKPHRFERAHNPVCDVGTAHIGASRDIRSGKAMLSNTVICGQTA